MKMIMLRDFPKGKQRLIINNDDDNDNIIITTKTLSITKNTARFWRSGLIHQIVIVTPLKMPIIRHTLPPLSLLLFSI
jgi:hypothetical protein